MKHILILLTCLLATTAFSQKLELNEVDEFTGSINKRTKLVKFHTKVSEVYVLQVAKFETEHVVSFARNPTLGCAGDVDNYVMFLFDDGSTLELNDDIADIDCGGFPKSSYVFDPIDFEGKEVVKIRLRMGSSPHDVEWMMKRSKFTFNELVNAVQ